MTGAAFTGSGVSTPAGPGPGPVLLLAWLTRPHGPGGPVALPPDRKLGIMAANIALAAAHGARTLLASDDQTLAERLTARWLPWREAEDEAAATLAGLLGWPPDGAAARLRTAAGRYAAAPLPLLDLLRLALAVRRPGMVWADSDARLIRWPLDPRADRPFFACHDDRRDLPGLVVFAVNGRTAPVEDILRRAALDVEAGTWPRFCLAFGELRGQVGLLRQGADFAHERE